MFSDKEITGIKQYSRCNFFWHLTLNAHSLPTDNLLIGRSNLVGASISVPLQNPLSQDAESNVTLSQDAESHVTLSQDAESN